MDDVLSGRCWTKMRSAKRLAHIIDIERKQRDLHRY
ncbi:hypothetical protein X772_35690 [Mesorhizobium sp. LSJC280B00]|nr:hypothetical protein X772_35690 [Mesorhizobium sp. LSJC280B00]